MSQARKKESNRSDKYATTANPETIRRWVEDQGGHPARVKNTGGKNDPGLLRIDFPGFSGEGTLEPISWEEFLRKFEESKLALIFDQTGKTRFNKIISRRYVEKDGGSHLRDVSRQQGNQANKQDRPMSIFDKLQQDHREVQQLFRKVMTNQSNNENREELFEQIRINLTAHADAEEVIFYPILMEESEEDAFVATVEHNLVRVLLEDLERTIANIDSPLWKAKCRVVSEMVDHHIEEEESELFKLARKALSKEDALDLGVIFTEEEEEEKESIR
jgi:hemerythrin-like domain-containing protein